MSHTKRRPLFASVATVCIAAAVAAVVAATFGAAGCRGPATGPSPEVAAAISKSKAAHPDRWKRKVVLLGFDSCDPDLVDQLIREGKLPNFGRLRRDGASGVLESTTPPLSPVVWTSISTGMYPERHGILDFVTETPKGIVPVSSKLRQADTFWDDMSRCGESVGVVGWLVTYPAEPVNGYLVTDRMGLLAYDYGKAQDTKAPLRTWPDDLAAEIEKTDRVTIDDLPLWKIRPFADVTEAEYRDSYTEKFHPANRLGNLRLALATAETFRASGQRLHAERPTRFFASYFEMMDALSHIFMRFAPPKLPDVDEADYLKYRTAIEANYVWHDRVLGEYLARADSDTTVFVVSDHGFKSGDFRRGDPSDFHAKTGAQWHRPFGVIYVWGNGVATGARIDGASVFDVAPTILAAMGYPKPADMPGRVLEKAFEGGLPHEQVATYFGETRREKLVEEGLASKQNDRDLTPEQQAELERMAALGYISGDRSDPSSSQLNLGQIYLTKGRIDDAIVLFQAVLKKRPTPNAYACLSEAYLLTGRVDEALVNTKLGLELDPTDVQCQLLRARIHMAQGEAAQGEELARAVVLAHPDLPQARGSLALILEKRMKEAEKAGDAGRVAKYRSEALAEQEAALRLEPNQIPSLLSVAELILGNPPDVTGPPRALERLDRLLQLRPRHIIALNDRSVAHVRLGIIAQGQENPAEAKLHLDQAVADATLAVDLYRERSGKEYSRGWANRAYALWRLGRLDEARDAVLKARTGDPSYRFAQQFEDEMAKSGRVIPPPAPKPDPAAGGEAGANGTATPPGPPK